MRDNIFIPYFTISITLLFSGCNLANDSQDPATEVEKNEILYPVEISTIVAGDNKDIISSVGTLRFRRETALGFTTSGKVSNVQYNEGDRVRRGSLIAALDSTTVNADIGLARAELDRAKSEFDRIEKLFEQGWITKSQLERSQANYQAAQARIEQANFASDTAKLYAPSDGIIIRRNIDRGQIIAAGSPALIFGQSDSGYIMRIPLTSSDAAKINVGIPVDVSVSSIKNKIFSARVTEIDGRANEQTGAFFAIVELPEDSRFKSGQIGTANFIIANDEHNIAIPSSAISGIRASEAIIYVYNAESQNVALRNIRLGKLSDIQVEVREGLSIGEQIVIKGHEKLTDGDRVKVVNRGEANNALPENSSAAKALAKNALKGESAEK